MIKMHCLIFLFIALFCSCAESLTTECPSIVCTQEFRSVTVQFKDSGGKPLIVKDFKAIIRRNGMSIKSAAVDTVNFKGSYAVATDADRKYLLESGDTIDVQALNPKTNQQKVTSIVVSGGKCACHIEKMSGAEVVVFD